MVAKVVTDQLARTEKFRPVPFIQFNVIRSEAQFKALGKLTGPVLLLTENFHPVSGPTADGLVLYFQVAPGSWKVVSVS